MEGFNYTYSAKQQEEIQKIRKKYMAPEEDKMDLLRKLDYGVTRKATAVSIATGVIGTLLLGIGMCCIMVWAEPWAVQGIVMGVIGIIVGVIGIAILCCAYPLYNHTVKKEREKIAPEIIRLTDELMK